MKKLFMASLAITTLALSIGLFQITSCTKALADPPNSCPVAKYPVTGLWEGTYQTDQVTHNPTYISFIIFPDGTFMKRTKVVGANGEYGLTKGRWTITGNILEYKDTTILYSGGIVVNQGQLTYDSSGVLTGGRWQDVSGQSYTGTYQTMNRNN
ncbi:hypothetical protein [Flavihumibacter profundi]|jgi:hypothetical protein|uniref:hypothetical protein n=1 Tax=Flavihumibacter profundi TaxID=2716883 RepID=UPI001CC41A58|nr:hypothetical protein [Flavihumibacter profundi]MBZ5855539.1 hypothetical protein [Flavihumibacter profundi]